MFCNVFRSDGNGALVFYLPGESTSAPIPFFLSAVQAGFPSPADDYLEHQLDLHQLLIRHPASTFFVKAKGESMRDAGIGDGDMLIVDRAITPRDGHIAVCFVNGEFTVKRLSIPKKGVVHLLAENPKMPPIILREGEELKVFGVVTYVIKQVTNVLAG